MTNHTEVLRTEQLNVKLTDEEVARLNKLAAHYSLSPQSVLRMLLKRAADELDAAVPVAKRAPKR
jgi:antitoxin component of RelBE/YafQ-DinJ toxin-antitoxin module